jgi:HK97 family phage major capsid protein
MLEGTTALPQPAFSTATDGTTVTPQSDPVFVGGSVGANPMIFSALRLSFKTKVSNQLFAQASRIFEPVLRNVISRGISSILDNLALYGTGTNGQPLGVYSTVTPVNLTTTPLTWSGTLPKGYTNYRELVRETDLDPDSYGVIISPAIPKTENLNPA